MRHLPPSTVLYRPLPTSTDLSLGLTLAPTCTPNTFSPELRCNHSRRAFRFHRTEPLNRSAPSPPCAGGRLVARREENGIWLAARCAVAGGDLEWRVVDLQAHGAAVFGVAPEPGANQRRPRAQ